MFLTITNTQKLATDIGYLFHKNPSKVQTFELSYGKAHVFYPHIQEEKCTITLVLDINPVDLAKKYKGNASESFALGQYVNDRPYVSSSFLSQAIAKVFSSALNGNCASHPELVTQKFSLTAKIFALPVKAEQDVLQRLFEPLGYKLSFVKYPLDEKFPQWGDSHYYTVELQNTLTVQELLSHLYILIPVLDKDKHYFIGEDEVQKLLTKGEKWLKNHPEKEFITRRYLRNLKTLTSTALEKLLEADESSPEEVKESKKMDLGDNTLDQATGKNLNQIRLESVWQKLKEREVETVIDLGCGEGKLLRMLYFEKQFKKIAGMDVSMGTLQRAKAKLHADDLPLRQKERLSLFQGSLIYKDSRTKEFDAATLVEVIEHIDPERLSTVERVLFEYTKPSMVIVTTPNKEYNANFENLYFGEFRHEDHRFEWTRKEFKQWSEKIGKDYGYKVEIFPIGPIDENLGPPTQMAIFTL